MEPVPETVDVLHRLRQNERDPQVLDRLVRLTARVQRLVPTCTGLSIGMADSGITLAFVADSSEAAEMDAVRYLADVPPDDAPTMPVGPDPPYVAGDDPTDEESWRLLGLTHGPVGGIQSSLTIPLLEHGSVMGWVNLYATTAEAFEDGREALAELCGGWAPGAVLNADLSFSSRLRAAAAPAMLDDQERVDQATGILCEALDLDRLQARARIRSAAVRAGVAEPHLARTVIDARRD